MTEEDAAAAEYDADRLAAELVAAVRRIAELEAERLLTERLPAHTKGATVPIERALVIVILALLAVFIILVLF